MLFRSPQPPWYIDQSVNQSWFQPGNPSMVKKSSSLFMTPPPLFPCYPVNALSVTAAPGYLSPGEALFVTAALGYLSPGKTLSVTASPRPYGRGLRPTSPKGRGKKVLRLQNRLLGSPFGGAVRPKAGLRGGFLLNLITLREIIRGLFRKKKEGAR